MTVSLGSYRLAERRMAEREAMTGLRIHGAITAVVCVGLILLNVFVASEFPWAIFPVLGMAIGVAVHWYFGVRHGDEAMTRHQDAVEREAERTAKAA